MKDSPSLLRLALAYLEAVLILASSFGLDERSLPASGSEELEVESISESTAKSETPSYTSPAYDELLELMTRATTQLSLEWSGPKHEDTRGQLNKRYLPGNKSPAPLSLSFVLVLHTKVAGSWKHTYSACIVPLNL